AASDRLAVFHYPRHRRVLRILLWLAFVRILWQMEESWMHGGIMRTARRGQHTGQHCDTDEDIARWWRDTRWGRPVLESVEIGGVGDAEHRCAIPGMAVPRRNWSMGGAPAGGSSKAEC